MTWERYGVVDVSAIGVSFHSVAEVTAGCDVGVSGEVHLDAVSSFSICPKHQSSRQSYERS